MTAGGQRKAALQKGRISMDRYIFAFPSVTKAMRALTILKNSGFSGEIVRTPRNLSAGCGYSVAAEGDPGIITEILEKNGITPKASGKI